VKSDSISRFYLLGIVSIVDSFHEQMRLLFPPVKYDYKHVMVYGPFFIYRAMLIYFTPIFAYSISFRNQVKPITDASMLLHI